MKILNVRRKTTKVCFTRGLHFTSKKIFYVLEDIK